VQIHKVQKISRLFAISRESDDIFRQIFFFFFGANDAPTSFPRSWSRRARARG
jgi:hypothetical protein